MNIYIRVIIFCIFGLTAGTATNVLLIKNQNLERLLIIPKVIILGIISTYIYKLHINKDTALNIIGVLIGFTFSFTSDIYIKRNSKKPQ